MPKLEDVLTREDALAYEVEHARARIAELEAARLTFDEVVAAIFAVDNYKTKARRDRDLLRPDHEAAVDRVLRKLRDEFDRLYQPSR